MIDLRTISLADMTHTPFRGRIYDTPDAFLAEYGYTKFTPADIVWLSTKEPDELVWFVRSDHPQLTEDEAFFIARVLVSYHRATLMDVIQAAFATEGYAA